MMVTGVHVFPLLSVRQQGHAGADENVEEILWKVAGCSYHKLPE